MIYISGKITGNKYYKRDFKKAERKLKRTGYKCIINPTKIKLPKIATYNDYIRVDNATVSQDHRKVICGYKTRMRRQ